MSKFISNRTPEQNLDRAIGMLKKYKDRESQICRELGRLQLALRADNIKRCDLILASLMQTNLAEAQAATQDHDIALKLAVQVLETHQDAMTRGTAACKALGTIRQLVPAVFGVEEVTG